MQNTQIAHRPLTPMGERSVQQQIGEELFDDIASNSQVRDGAAAEQMIEIDTSTLNGSDVQYSSEGPDSLMKYCYRPVKESTRFYMDMRESQLLQ